MILINGLESVLEGDESAIAEANSSPPCQPHHSPVNAAQSSSGEILSWEIKGSRS